MCNDYSWKLFYRIKAEEEVVGAWSEIRVVFFAFKGVDDIVMGKRKIARAHVNDIPLHVLCRFLELIC